MILPDPNNGKYFFGYRLMNLSIIRKHVLYQNLLYLYNNISISILIINDYFKHYATATLY